MPYQFEFDSAHRILRCRLDGAITDEELKACYREAERYARQTDPLSAIMDMSEVTAFSISAKTIQDLALSPPAMPHPERLRIVIAPLPQIFGIARMFEMAGQETRPDVHVVRNASEALALAGVKEAKFEPIQLQ